MSRKIDIVISCPYCGFSQSVSVYTSVNVTLDPELQDEIFDDRVNRLECSECGKSSLVNMNLMYHDMERKFAVWFCSQGDLPEIEKQAFAKIAESMGIGGYLSEAPTTYTWEEFKSTILEFEE